MEALTHRDQEFFDGMAEATHGVERAADRLRMVIDGSCPPQEGIAHDNDWPLWLEMWSRSRHDEDLAAARARLDALFRGTVSAIVKAGIDAGEFDRAVDPQRFAILLTSLIDGLAIQVLLRDRSVTRQTMRGLCLETAARELGCAAVLGD